MEEANLSMDDFGKHKQMGIDEQLTEKGKKNRKTTMEYDQKVRPKGNLSIEQQPHGSAVSNSNSRGSQSSKFMGSTVAQFINEYLNKNTSTLFKICVVGNQGVGKTNLIRQYIQAKKAENNHALKHKQRISTGYNDPTPKKDEPEEDVLFEHADELNQQDQEISDVEKVTFLYKNEVPVTIEFWDTVGQEKYNQYFIYSQNYLKGKHGIVLMVDGCEFTQENNTPESQKKGIAEVVKKIKMIDESIVSPILLIFNKVPTTPEELINLNNIIL